MGGKLYVVGTPIGNLEDISLRALRVLKEADMILAEDTRRTQGLLNHYNIKTRLTSFYRENERQQAEAILERLRGGEQLALVSDAGLPAISDPGGHLIGLVAREGLGLEVVPGPTASVLALLVSGLPAERFTFWGFIPRKAKDRQEIFKTALSRPETAIFYEAPTRIADSLAELQELAAERPAAVVREMTKIYEEVQRGSLKELADLFGVREAKGEICLVVAGAAEGESLPWLAKQGPPPSATKLVADLEAQGFSPKEAQREAARQLGISRRDVYRQLLAAEEK